MKILFIARHYSYFRNFDSVLQALAERGHTIHVAVEREEAFGGREMIDRLAAQYPSITAGFVPPREDGWYRLATRLRLGLDYLRYLEPAYAGTPGLKARAARRAPPFVRAIAESPSAGPVTRRLLAKWLWATEQAIPVSEEARRYLREQAPDVMLLSPLLGVVESPQLDYLYAAKSLGIPTALCVWSWDHLSSKALIRTVPERVIVWNETQRQEAERFHGVPRERVAVTGAQCFDRWFDRSPSRPREEFCRRVGLRDARPFVLWVCSSLFKGSPPEAAFVVRWIQALRESSDPAVRDANILVRPHPQRLTEWEQIDLASLPGVAFWGSNPVDGDSRADYYDSLYYSAAIAGLNTSAFVEGSIVGRPIYAVLPPEYHDNQEGTIHFHYLLTVGGGLLRTSRTLEEHAGQLGDALRGSVPDPDRSRRFAEAFVRPQGLSRASTPLFVEAVESLPWVARIPLRARASLLGRLSLQRLQRWSLTDSGRQWIDGAKPPKQKKPSAKKRAPAKARTEAGIAP